MKNILKVIVALGVFTMTIGSSFAMDTNPPTEPVKTTVKTEVVEEVQPALVGYGYFDYDLEECFFLAPGSPGVDCSPTNPGDICTDINGDLYYMSRATEHDEWVCGAPLRKPLLN